MNERMDIANGENITEGDVLKITTLVVEVAQYKTHGQTNRQTYRSSLPELKNVC